MSGECWGSKVSWSSSQCTQTSPLCHVSTCNSAASWSTVHQSPDPPPLLCRDGTTDVTRTVHFGTPTRKQKVSHSEMLISFVVVHTLHTHPIYLHTLTLIPHTFTPSHSSHIPSHPHTLTGSIHSGVERTHCTLQSCVSQ